MTRTNVATYVAWAGVTMLVAGLFVLDRYRMLVGAVGQRDAVILSLVFLVGARALGREISIAMTTILRRRKKKQARESQPG